MSDITFSKHKSYDANDRNILPHGDLHAVIMGYLDRRRDYIGHNLLHSECSQIVLDTSDYFYKNAAPYLRNKGYNVYYLNLDDIKNSDCYNPLHYLYDKNGCIDDVAVDELCESLYCECKKIRDENLNEKERGLGDPFWNKCCKILLYTMIYYVLENDDIALEKKDFNALHELSVMFCNRKSFCDVLYNTIKQYNEESGRFKKTRQCWETYLITPDRTARDIAFICRILFECLKKAGCCEVTNSVGAFGTPHYIDLNKLGKTTSFLFIASEHSTAFLSVILSQICFYLERNSRTFSEQYMLCNERHVAQLEPFDSMDEIQRFRKDAKRDRFMNQGLINIVENNGSYALVWENHVLKVSEQREYLKKLIENVGQYESVPCRTKFPVPVLMYVNNIGNIAFLKSVFYLIHVSRLSNIGVHLLFDRDHLFELLKDDEGAIREVIRSSEFRCLLNKLDVVGNAKDDDRLKRLFGIQNIPPDSVTRSKIYLHSDDDKSTHEDYFDDPLPFWMSEEYERKWSMKELDDTYKIAETKSSCQLQKKNCFEPQIPYVIETSVDASKKKLVREILRMHPVFTESAALPKEFNGYFLYRMGKVEETKVDVVVCPVNYDLSGGAQVASAIFRFGGDKVLKNYKAYCMQHINSGIRNAFCVDASDTGLMCRSVCFTPMDDRIDLEDTDEIYKMLFSSYYSALSSIEVYGSQESISVCFPLLGAGAGGYSPQLSAEAAINAYVEYNNNMRNMQKRKSISMVLMAYDNNGFKGIEDAVRFYAFKQMMVDVILNSKI